MYRSRTAIRAGQIARRNRVPLLPPLWPLALLGGVVALVALAVAAWDLQTVLVLP